MPKTTSILKISKNKKNAFFLMFQGPLKQKIRFLAQKMCPAARGQTNNSQTNKQTQKQKQRPPYRVFKIPFFQPTIKERSNIFIFL